MTGFHTPHFILEYIDGKKWLLTTPLVYETQVGRVITVPAGFVTDFASVPKIFQNIFPPTGPYGKAAVVHDFLYVKNGCTRGEADGMFLEAMDALGVNRSTRWSLYSAVRMGGWKPWNAYRKAEQN